MFSSPGRIDKFVSVCKSSENFTSSSVLNSDTCNFQLLVSFLGHI